jgi:tellurite resistance protein TehA-like permease
MSIGLLVAGLAPLVSMEVEAANVPHWLVEGRLIAWLALWGVLGVSILIRCVQAIINPVPQRMQSAVGNAIMSLITLDAVLVLAFCGEQWAVSVLALLVWFVLGRRIAAVT